MREADLLAILDAGPIGPEALAFMSRGQRRLAQAGIDALIDYLDAITPDANLEPEDEDDFADCEPNLGAPEHMMSLLPRWWGCVDPTCSQLQWAKGCRDDREVECEDEGACIQSQPHDAEPVEPSLGAPENTGDQTVWSPGACDDGERDASDSEPSLGSLDGQMHQGAWSRGLGSEEGDFDEVRHPQSGSLDREERRRQARDVAGTLLDRHGLRRLGNVGPLLRSGPGGELLGRVA